MVRAAVSSALEAAFPDLPLRPLENVQVAAPKDAEGRPLDFLGLFYLATETPKGIGRGCFRESGTVNVVIYRPAGRGVDAAVTTADAIRNQFAHRDVPVAAPGVRLALHDAAPLSSYLGRPGAPTGAYFVGLVAIAYTFDFTRG
jgi:hypothetical protein